MIYWTDKNGDRRCIDIAGIIAWIVAFVACFREDVWMLILPAIYLLMPKDD